MYTVYTIISTRIYGDEVSHVLQHFRLLGYKTFVVDNSLDTLGGAMATALADQLKARQLKVVGKFALQFAWTERSVTTKDQRST